MAGRGFDLTGVIQSAFHLFKGKLQTICDGPCDGFVLKLHYRWTFFFAIGGFMTVFYGWFNGKVIHCISTFKGDEAARTDYQNICLSYPYVEGEKGEKRFILYYRWIHWSFLLLASLYYIPRKISKSVEIPKAKKILEDLATLSPRYDQSEKDKVHRATFYMVNNMRTHNSIYFKYLTLNILALLIDFFVLRFLDFMFHNRFIKLIPNSYPFYRDPENFKDYLSQTFPPFVSCTLKDAHKILDGRQEEIGCHLIQMELYEKIFFVFWFILIGVIIITLCYIIFLMCMMVPSIKHKFISGPKPLQSTTGVRVVISKMIGNLKVGDIYMLYRLKQHVGPARFYEVLINLGDPKLKPNNPNPEPINDMKIHHKIQDPNLRNRHHTEPPLNPQFDVRSDGNQNKLNKLLSDQKNIELLKRYPDLMKLNNVKDTSILIE